MEPKNILEELPPHTKTIKVDVRTWSSLKNLKKQNETFQDTIKDLLNERTRSMETNNLKAIKYSRKILFLKGDYISDVVGEVVIGIECEYNDIANQQMDFTLDLKIKKIFYGKRAFNPSQFFGVDHHHKHLSPIYLNLYLRCIEAVLMKEFKGYSGMIHNSDFEDIARWKYVYYQYSLSQESFIHDIEEPLRLSEEEKPTKEQERRIKESIATSIWEK